MRLKSFLDAGIVALNFAGEDRDIHILLAFGEITHFKGLNSCIVFCFDCIITLIFAVQCGKKL